MSDDLVVTITPTIMDGTVIRWFRSTDAAEAHLPFLSASRNGVRVHDGYLTDIPDAVLETARGAYEALRRDNDADLSGLATHRARILARGPLTPIARAEAA